MAQGRTEMVRPPSRCSDHDEASEFLDSIDDIPRPVPLSDLSAFRRDLLFVVSSFEGTDTVPAGVAIIENLRSISANSVTQGRFYQNLRELVAEDLVEKRPIDGRTNAYYLRTSAAEALATRVAWERNCLALPENMEDERNRAESKSNSGVLRWWR